MSLLTLLKIALWVGSSRSGRREMRRFSGVSSQKSEKQTCSPRPMGDRAFLLLAGVRTRRGDEQSEIHFKLKESYCGWNFSPVLAKQLMSCPRGTVDIPRGLQHPALPSQLLCTPFFRCIDRNLLTPPAVGGRQAGSPVPGAGVCV